MELNVLNAISPVDGRYRNKTSELAAYFSESALFRYRVKAEIEYFIALCELPLPQLKNIEKAKTYDLLRKIYETFSDADAVRIKEIEKTTNHDVKAVEYFLKEKFDESGLAEYREFIHFGLTSQDVNNTAFPLAIKDALENSYFPGLKKIIDILNSYAEGWKDVPMLARTHGQPASPTRLGKEIKVFAYRLEKQAAVAQSIPVTAKFGGATGNFNAHNAAYPEIKWDEFADRFIYEKLGLVREKYTTQISNYDALAALFDALKRIDTIIIDLCRDMWLYISMDYFKQKIEKGEVGSSAMPHKVNPIDFENAEGNLEVADALLTFMSAKLPISRLQRDLTDSTVMRNTGVAFAHCLIALKSLEKGLKKVELNPLALDGDLNRSWAVVAEAIQTILRREGYPEPYETLKALTRTGGQITQLTIENFINSLNVSNEVKNELKQITPHNYTGINFMDF
ncbi:MAG: adenylosuccinate lyase [Dysgonamonadaceae bacterium]|jgi:adenylosuccinate lyase|nr:adenylosuccinate lyase [Dysgonamonadaceae bacterium]